MMKMGHWSHADGPVLPGEDVKRYSLKFNSQVKWNNGSSRVLGWILDHCGEDCYCWALVPPGVGAT